MANVSLEGMSAEQITDLAILAKAQLDNPVTRPHFLQNSKVVNPESSIPEIDIPMRVNKMLQSGKEMIDKQATEIANMRLERDIERRREVLMKKHGLSENDVSEVEKLMLEKQIASHDTAAEFYNSQKQSARPSPSMFSPNTMPKINLKESGMPNMSQWARNEAGKTLDEFRGRIRVS